MTFAADAAKSEILIFPKKTEQPFPTDLQFPQKKMGQASPFFKVPSRDLDIGWMRLYE